MSHRKAHDELKIDNLIYKLNHAAQRRKEIYDKLWVLEEQTEQMRLERQVNQRAGEMLMPDTINRIGKGIDWWESQLRPTPEREAYIKLKLSGLAFEAMEEAGQLKLWSEV